MMQTRPSPSRVRVRMRVLQLLCAAATATMQTTGRQHAHATMQDTAAPARPRALSARKYMFLDAQLLANASAGVEMTYAPMYKVPENPLICETEPWELTFRHMYASVARETEKAGAPYRCYYNAWLFPDHHGATLLATSRYLSPFTGFYYL